jgi:integrase
MQLLCEGAMKLPRRKFLHLVAGAAALPAIARARLPPRQFSLRRMIANGRRLTNKRSLKAATVEAALAPITFHGLRHTYASRLAMNGVPLAVIATQLGHSDIRMVEKHYGHLAPNYVADTVRAPLAAQVSLMQHRSFQRRGVSNHGLGAPGIGFLRATAWLGSRATIAAIMTYTG